MRQYFTPTEVSRKCKSLIILSISQGGGERDNCMYTCVQTLKSILESNSTLANIYMCINDYLTITFLGDVLALSKTVATSSCDYLKLFTFKIDRH